MRVGNRGGARDLVYLGRHVVGRGAGLGEAGGEAGEAYPRDAAGDAGLHVTAVEAEPWVLVAAAAAGGSESEGEGSTAEAEAELEAEELELEELEVASTGSRFYGESRPLAVVASHAEGEALELSKRNATGYKGVVSRGAGFALQKSALARAGLPAAAAVQP